MVAVFCERWACKLDNFVKQSQFIYWIIFWFVYSIGWLKGFLSVPAGSLASNLVFYIGFVWFIIIAIILLRSPGQARSQVE
jgi:hypothetical protein